MTEDEKKLLEEEFTKAGSVPALLEAMAREETKEFQNLKDQVQHGPHHPTGDELYNYVLGWLDREESLLVMDHLVLCGRCLREVITIRKLEEELTEDALARADRVPLLESLKRLVSKLSFPVSIYEPALGVARGADQAPEERHYKPGTDLVLSIEAPADGYVTVLHGCEETGKVELVFPVEPEDNPRVAAGQEMPPITGKVEGPSGKHWFKMFWTRQLPFDRSEHDLATEYGRHLALEEFCDRVAQLSADDFRISVVEYDVVNE